MPRATYTETTCKQALNRVEGMPCRWSLNPYRGCVHACHYCYARATHAYLGLNAGSDSERQILVKTNIAAVLAGELARPGWRGEPVAIGTVTDPYQPAEGRHRLTRACLDALGCRHNPVSIVTKSPLVLRDLDLLAELSRTVPVRVSFTVTTLEPGTPPPAQRLAALARLTAAGVPAGVFLAPVLPGLTDDEAGLAAVAVAARAAGADAL